MTRKNVQIEVGDVFRLPISERRSGFGQIFAKYENNMLFMVLFSLESENDKIPPISTIVASQPLFVANSMDAKIWHGEWPILGNSPPDYYKTPLPKYKIRVAGVVHVESYDGLQMRPATAFEENILSFRKCVYPQILEDALRDSFGELKISQFSPAELERLRKEFVSMKPEVALVSAGVGI